MSDPLDAVFVTGEESSELKRAATARSLATYLERMPVELRAMFSEQFHHITSAELAQLRSRVDMLDILEGDDGLAAANRLMDACERGDIPQHILPDIQMARNEIVALRADLQAANEELETYSKLGVILNVSSAADVVGAVDALYTELRMSHERIAEQARQLETALELILSLDGFMRTKDAIRNPSLCEMIRAWLDAHPAPQATVQKHCDCGMGDATLSVYHPDDCALNTTQ